MLQITRRPLTLATIVLSVFGVLPAMGQVINEDLKLLASDGAWSDEFGNSIAIDGGIIAVGAHNDNNKGSVYLCDVSTGIQLAKLIANDGAAFDSFGNSLAIDGGIVAVGVPYDDDYGSNSGSAYLFDAYTGVQTAKLLPSFGATLDYFGHSIAIDGGIVVVGAYHDDDNGSGSGSAYLFDAATGVQIAKLLPSDGAMGDRFGCSVSINNGIVAVGANGDYDNGVDSGSAYLFDAATGVQIAKLLPNDGAANDDFGSTIAISNGMVAIGAPHYNGNANATGSAYLFSASTGTQLAKLIANDGEVSGRFGGSISISNGIVAVGASFDNDNGLESGSAYLFDAATGVQIAKLLPSDGAVSDLFGSSIAIDGGIVVVGAELDDDNNSNSGSAYVFDTREENKLLANDGEASDAFGSSIAIDNGIVAVGAMYDSDNVTFSGSAYLFDSSTGNQLAKLLAVDGAVGDQFGVSIAIDNGIVAVGADFDGDFGTKRGSVYLFDASTGVQTAKLLASDAAIDDYFGHSIDIDNGIVAVGAYGDDDNGQLSGSAYLFDAATGVQLAKLLPSDGAAGDSFGRSIAIGNGIVAVGAYHDDDNGFNSGSVYLFDASTGTLLTKILASDGAQGDKFGFSVDIDNGLVAVGAWGDDDSGAESGSAYVFSASTGTQLAKLIANDGGVNDWFGNSISISNGIVTVGAHKDDDNGSESGSAYLFDALTGVQTAKLLPSDGASDDLFGNTVAISNGIVAVGAWLDDDNGPNSGSAYVFDVREENKMLADDGAAYDRFGNSIDIDSGIVAVAAPGNEDNGFLSGSAYLFDAATRYQLAKLLPSDGAYADKFGRSISIDNGVVAVGAYGDDDNGSDSGSAYLFDATTGVQTAKLLPSDGASNEYFGYSIAVEGGTVAVGAYYDDDNGTNSGSAYLFDAATGVQTAKLLPSDGTAYSRFGYSIAIDGGVVAVGAYLDDDNGAQSGSAYLFDATAGIQIVKLLPNDGAATDYFGYGVAIGNGAVVVGAPRNDDYGSNSGSAYLFNAATGVQIAKLLPSDGAADDWFGGHVAISNGIVAVGAYNDDDNGTDSGSVYLFDAYTGAQIEKLNSLTGAANDKYGISVAIDNGMLAIGALNDDDNGTDSGSAYVYQISYAPCRADMNRDGFLDFFDVSVFIAAFAAMDPAADFSGDGLFDFFDVSGFLQAFGIGCP